MLSISYTKTDELVKMLRQIDEFRTKILLCAIPLSELRQMRYAARVSRIVGLSLLLEEEVSKKKVTDFFIGHAEADSVEHKNLRHLQNVFDYIYEDWYGNPNKVGYKEIVNIAAFSFRWSEKKAKNELKKNQKNIEYVLDYIQSYNEHPVLQAALGYVAMNDLFRHITRSHLVSAGFSFLFLCKYGYDCNRLVELSSYFSEHIVEYRKLLSTESEAYRLNSWLMFYTAGFKSQLAKLVHTIEAKSAEAVFTLNRSLITARQKKILSLCDVPDSRITNKFVQNAFGISQITASRDLSKLAMLGFLFAHGKGRSVYYTRA